MLEVTTLAFPCPDCPCILDTDSSNVAYGSVLSQLVDVAPSRFFHASCHRRNKIIVQLGGNLWQ